MFSFSFFLAANLEEFKKEENDEDDDSKKDEDDDIKKEDYDIEMNTQFDWDDLSISTDGISTDVKTVTKETLFTVINGINAIWSAQQSTKRKVKMTKYKDKDFDIASKNEASHK